MTAPTPTEFLLACIAEDEANIDGDWAGGDGGLHIISMRMHDRMLAECEAKRRIVEDHREDGGECRRCDDGYWGEGDDGAEQYSPWRITFPCPTVRALATVYADHTDFDEAWRA